MSPHGIRIRLLDCRAERASSIFSPPSPEQPMNGRRTWATLSLLLAAFAAPRLSPAQQPAAPATPTPEVGTMAPDFTIAGATRFGLLRDSVRLSALRGQTVVLAFFFQARTKG